MKLQFFSIFFLTQLSGTFANQDCGPQMRNLKSKIEASGSTEIDLKFAKEHQLAPRGSAVLTSSGKLKDVGITAIIQAAPAKRGSRPGSEILGEPTLQSIQNSSANSVRLAETAGHTKIAILFIGGGIFKDRVGQPVEEIAKAVILGALEGSPKMEISFVLLEDENYALFKKVLLGLEQGKTRSNVRVLQGSIIDFGLHGASAIVNAANMEVRFGNGISGVIGRATGEIDAIDKEAAEIVLNFNQQ